MKTLAILFLTLASTARADDLTDQERAYMTMVKSQVVYRVDGMDRVTVTKNVRYSTADDPRLVADFYSPAGAQEELPVVVFIHGGGALDTPIAPKDWRPYQSWGRLAAAHGFLGVTFNHRLGFPAAHLDQAAADVRALLAYVRAHAGELHADPDRVALAAFSAGGPLLTLAMHGDTPGVKCLLSWYNLLDIRTVKEYVASDGAEKVARFSAVTFAEHEPAHVPPMFIARGGRDTIPELNPSIDRFVAAAIAHDLDVTVANHPQGTHGFDFNLDDARSREIVEMSMEFLTRHLQPEAADARADLEKTLLDIETRRRAAIAAKDFATLEAIYAADFRAVFGNGEYFDRPALFDIFRGDDGKLAFTTDELAVRRIGDAATVTGRLTARSGDSIVSQQRFTHIYGWREGRWQIVAAEGTPVRRMSS